MGHNYGKILPGSVACGLDGGFRFPGLHTEVKVLFTGLPSPAQGVLSRGQETRKEEETPEDLYARDIPGLSPAVFCIPDMG